MRAITYSKLGTAKDVLNLQNLNDVAPQTGEVRVALTFSGVNPSDVKSHRGRPGLERPAFETVIPHSDGAGVIEAKRGIAPHIPVIDKSGRKDGTFERADFTFEAEKDLYICPGGKELKQFRRAFATPRSGANKDATKRYRARKSDCDASALKQRCTPKEPQRKVTRSIYETSRDVARGLSQTQQYAISSKLRKKVEMSFAHLKRIHGLGRLRLRGPCGAHDEFILAATAQNLKKLAKLAPHQNQIKAAA